MSEGERDPFGRPREPSGDSLWSGRPTEGERRTSQLVQLADGIRAGGVTMSTLGLGLDYNNCLLDCGLCL